MTRKIFEKTYHGYEDFYDYTRDLEEAVDCSMNPVMLEIPGDFKGRMKVVITYEDDTETNSVTHQ